jgi:hypothetical protein
VSSRPSSLAPCSSELLFADGSAPTIRDGRGKGSSPLRQYAGGGGVHVPLCCLRAPARFRRLLLDALLLLFSVRSPSLRFSVCLLRSPVAAMVACQLRRVVPISVLVGLESNALLLLRGAHPAHDGAASFEPRREGKCSLFGVGTGWCCFSPSQLRRLKLLKAADGLCFCYSRPVDFVRRASSSSSCVFILFFFLLELYAVCKLVQHSCIKLATCGFVNSKMGTLCLLS